MRIKNLILGIAAIVLGVAGAFASPSQTQSGWISVRLLGMEIFTCLNTGLQCQVTGPVTCKIDVETMVGTITVTAKNGIGCATTLNSNTNVPIGSFEPLIGQILSAK